MTKNYSIRKQQHTGIGKKYHGKKYKMLAVATGLTKKEARAIEQALIAGFTIVALNNMINSIAKCKWGNFEKEVERVSLLMLSFVDPE